MSKDVKMSDSKNNSKDKPNSKVNDDNNSKGPPKTIEIIFAEDDAFEEFELDTWKIDKAAQNTEDADLWQDDWGDKDVDKCFENQLRNEITQKK